MTCKYAMKARWKEPEGLNEIWVVFDLAEVRSAIATGLAAISSANPAGSKIRSVCVHADFEVMTTAGDGIEGSQTPIESLRPWPWQEDHENVFIDVEAGVIEPHSGINGMVIEIGGDRNSGWVEFQWYDKNGDYEGFASFDGLAPDELLGMEDADVERRAAHTAGTA